MCIQVLHFSQKLAWRLFVCKNRAIIMRSKSKRARYCGFFVIIPNVLDKKGKYLFITISILFNTKHNDDNGLTGHRYKCFSKIFLIFLCKIFLNP